MFSRISAVSCRFILAPIFSDPYFYVNLSVIILIVSKPPFFFLRVSPFPFLVKGREKEKHIAYVLFTIFVPFFERALYFSNSFVEEGEQGKYYSFFKIYCALSIQNAPLFLFIRFPSFSKHLVNLMLFFLSTLWLNSSLNLFYLVQPAST